MADPYATDAPDLSGRPSGQPPWVEAVARRGGAILGSEPALEASGRFVVVACRGIGTMAPVARLRPPLATLLWLEHEPAARSAEAGNRMLELLAGSCLPILALKHGSVGGPPGREGCLEIGPALIEAVVDAALVDQGVLWEEDPDFGYEVPAMVPGLDPEAARGLLPRLLYADHDRVYEHAGLVAAKQQERYELAGAIAGLDPAIAAASGWPPHSRAPASGDDRRLR